MCEMIVLGQMKCVEVFKSDTLNILNHANLEG